MAPRAVRMIATLKSPSAIITGRAKPVNASAATFQMVEIMACASQLVHLLNDSRYIIEKCLTPAMGSAVSPVLFPGNRSSITFAKTIA